MVEYIVSIDHIFVNVFARNIRSAVKKAQRLICKRGVQVSLKPSKGNDGLWENVFAYPLNMKISPVKISFAENFR